MLPGPNYYYRCPRCSTVAYRRSIASGNTFGAAYWSDAKREAPMLPESPALVACPACNAYLWVASLTPIGQHDWYLPTARQLVGQLPIEPEKEPPEEWRNAPRFLAPEAKDLAQALDAGVADTPEREKYLRVRLWWSLNDQYRGEGNGDALRSNGERFQGNVDRLALLLDGSPNDTLLRAEIARESGSFTRSIELCDVLIGMDVVAHLKETAALIRARALQRDARVFRLDLATV